MAAVVVGTTATRIDTVNETDSTAGSAIAVNNNGSVTVYLGTSSNVSTADGFPLAAGASISVEFDNARQGLWGIVASGTAEVRTLELGVA